MGQARGTREEAARVKAIEQRQVLRTLQVYPQTKHACANSATVQQAVQAAIGAKRHASAVRRSLAAAGLSSKA